MILNKNNQEDCNNWVGDIWIDDAPNPWPEDNWNDNVPNDP